MVDTCDTTVCVSLVVVFLVGGVALVCLCHWLVVRLVLIKLITVFTVDTESVMDLLSTLIFFRLASSVLIVSASQ